MSDQFNTLRHAEVTPISLRMPVHMLPQRHVTQAECERVIHMQRNGRLMTWGVIDGGKREVWW